MNEIHKNGENLTNQEATGREIAKSTTTRLKAPVPYAINKAPLNDLLKYLFPTRKHLGSIVYNPTTTWATLQIEQLHGIDKNDKIRLLEIQSRFIERLNDPYRHEKVEYIPCLPPFSEAYINCFVEMKIPYKFIKEFLEDCESGRIQRKRELWGGVGGIYTDDSDILSVLKHLGVFDNNADLTEINESWKQEHIVRPLNIHKDGDGVELLDLSVTLLLLPTLKQYYGFFKNDINSRSWLGEQPHNGLSFGVWNIKWETYNTFSGDRYVRKRAQREYETDREAQQAIVENGKGWRFDYKCYKELKTKFMKLDAEKKTLPETVAEKADTKSLGQQSKR